MEELGGNESIIFLKDQIRDLKVALEKERYDHGVTRINLKEVGQEKIDFEIDLEVSRKENKKMLEKMEEFDGIDLSRYQE